MCVFSSRQRGDNVNVISNTGHAHEFGSEVAEDCRQISIHASRTLESSGGSIPHQ